MSEAMNPRNPVNPGQPGNPQSGMDQGYPQTGMEQGYPQTGMDQGIPPRPANQVPPTRPIGQSSSTMAMGQPGTLEIERPGLVTFAAMMMFILAGFQIVWAIVEFVNAAWLSSVTYGTFNGYLWLFAILDLVLAAAAFYAGYDIMRGGSFGRVFGVVVAGVSAIRWFFYLPAAPWIGVVMIAVDILIIYGLVANGEFFKSLSSAR